MSGDWSSDVCSSDLAPLPVRGGQDLAPRRPHGGELQRSVPGEGNVRAADGPVAPDCATWPGLRAGDGAGLTLKRPPPDLRAPCIEFYALTANAAKPITSARDLAGTDSREDDKAAKLELTYSTTNDINRAGPTLEMLVVCITHVKYYCRPA